MKCVDIEMQIWELIKMNVDEFRKIIMDYYKEAMQDCQLPTGALANLNPAE